MENTIIRHDSASWIGLEVGDILMKNSVICCIWILRNSIIIQQHIGIVFKFCNPKDCELGQSCERKGLRNITQSLPLLFSKLHTPLICSIDHALIDVMSRELSTPPTRRIRDNIERT